MLNQEERFFHTGGTLPIDASSYVTRDADTELLDNLRRGEFCYVLNTRQMGKSSLMVRTTRRLREEGTTVCVLDLTGIGHNLDVEQWYFGMLRRLSGPLGLDREAVDFWRQNRTLGPLQRWLEAIRQVVLPDLARREADGNGEKGRLIIFVDEIDAVRSLPFFTDEFFAGIRSCFNRRTEEPEFLRLTFCLLGVASPSDLIRDTRLSPFNIGRRILLTDFTLQEAEVLAAGLQGEDSQTRGTSVRNPGSEESSRLLGRILYWTGGHPYMTQRLCLAVAEARAAQGGPLSDLRQIDRICERLFLTKAARDTDDNLAFVRSRLLQSECDLASLLDLYTQVRSGKPVHDDETNPLCSVLRLSGVVKAMNGMLQVRNRIYDRVFDRDWVRAHMPDAELRRQQAAYWRGVIRTAALSLGILGVMATLAVTAVVQASRTVRATREARQNLRIAVAEKAQIGALNASLQAALRQQEQTNARLQSALVDARQKGVRLHREAARADNAALRAGQSRNLALLRENEADHARGIAQQQSQLALERLSKSRVDEGIRLMAENDLLGALPSFTEALRLDQGNPKQEERQRIRLASILDHTPRLTQSWFSEDIVNSASFSPDGNRIAIADQSGLLRVLNAQSGKALWQKRFRSSIQKARFSPNGEYLAMACKNGTAQVFSAWDGHPVTSLLPYSGGFQAEYKFSVAWRKDSRRLLIAGGELIRVWDLAPVKPLYTFRYLQGSMEEATFSPDGTRVAVALNHWCACVFDAATGVIQCSFDQCYNAYHVEFSPDGKLVLTSGDHASSGEKRIALFNSRTGWPVQVFDIPGIRAGTVERFRFSADGKAVAVGINHNDQGDISQRATVRVFSLTGTLLSPPIALSSFIWDIAPNTDASRILVACDNGSVTLWNARTGALSAPPLYHLGCVRSATFDPEGTRVLTAGIDHMTRLWNLSVGARHLFHYPASPLKSHLVLQKGTRLLLTFSSPAVSQLVDAVTGKLLKQFPGTKVSVSHDESRFAIFFQKTLRIYATRTGQPLTPAYPTPNSLDNGWGAHLCPDGRHYFTLSPEGVLQTFAVATGRAVGGSAEAIRRFDFTPEGDAVICHQDRDVMLWSSAEGRALTGLMRHDARVEDMWFVPGKRLLVTRTLADRFFLWDLVSGRLLAHIQRQQGGIEEQGIDLRLWANTDQSLAAIEPLSSRIEPLVSLATRGRNLRKEIYPPTWVATVGNSPFYNLANALFLPGGNLAGQKPFPALYEAHTGHRRITLPQSAAITDAEFSPEGRRVLTLGGRETARIWDIATGRPLTVPMRPGNNINKVSFSPDGQKVLTVDYEGHFLVWDAATGELLTPKSDITANFVLFSPDSHSLLIGTASEILRQRIVPDRRCFKDMALLPVLYSGRRIDSGGNFVDVTLSDLQSAWKRLRIRYPDDFTVLPSERVSFATERQTEMQRAQAQSDQEQTAHEYERMEQVQTATRIPQDDTDSWLALAQSNATHRRWEQTISATDQVLRDSPQNRSAWYLRGVAHLSLEQDSLASQDFAEMIAHGGNPHEATQISALIHRKQSRWRDVADDYARQWTQIGFPERTIPAYYEALAHIRSGDKAGYRAVCARLWATLRTKLKSPYWAEFLFWTLSLSPDALPDLGPVAELAERFCADHPEDANLLNAAGCFLARTGHYTEAISPLNRALRLGNVEYESLCYAFLGLAEDRSGHLEQARIYRMEARKKAEAYLEATREMADNDTVWSKRLQLELLASEADAPNHTL